MNNEKYPPFSVAISVYQKDNPEWFDSSLNSIVEQTVMPDEIVLVVDGPISEELHQVIEKYKKQCEDILHFCVIYLLQNEGLGKALQTAVSNCRNEWIARMDSDDVSSPDRFREQLQYIFEHHDVDLVGGDISEFIGEKTNVVGIRRVPIENEDIREYIKKRCPFNHMTVMYKKTAVEKAGGYLDWFCNEDYYLWLRMYQSGCCFANTGTVLVNVRVGNEMYQRRGGVSYFRSEISLQWYMFQNRIIRIPDFLMNCTKRFVVQLLLTPKIRGWVFRRFARSKE